jgi:hypothetical protein
VTSESYNQHIALLARLQRYLTEHPGKFVGYEPGGVVYCPGRRLVRDRRKVSRPNPSDRWTSPELRPCGYKWGHAGPDTRVHVRMIRDDLPRKTFDPALGSPPLVRAPSAFFKCPECSCEIEFLYYYGVFKAEER